MKIDAPCNAQVPALRSLWQEAFGDTEGFLDVFYQTAFSPGRSRCITIDGKTVAALYWFDCSYQDKPVAYLYAVATAKAFRGQGLCHKLLEDTHRYLESLGYEGAILVPGSAELFKLYEGMGYQTCCHIREFSCLGAAEGVPLHPISQLEYAKLRRQLLPEGGVLQEKENLDFLQKQAMFFAGTGFLATVRREKSVLDCIELLGDIAAAPGIVKALGYVEGKFRTPGLGRPFAMYYPLRVSKLPAPTYFGLAFD